MSRSDQAVRTPTPSTRAPASSAPRRCAPGGDPRRGWTAGVPAGLAGGHRGVRDRPAQGARRQGRRRSTRTACFRLPTRHAVGVDLRDNWPGALIDAGFDPRRSTAWLAEGLLPYLPADAQDRLFEKVTALSAPGSRIAVEAFAAHTSQTDEQRAEWRERTERLRRQLGLNDDFEALSTKSRTTPTPGSGCPSTVGRCTPSTATTRWPGWAVRCRGAGSGQRVQRAGLRLGSDEIGEKMSALRTDDDTWDIATSVGTTAVMVAAARAAETDRPDPLINDPYAKILVRRRGDRGVGADARRGGSRQGWPTSTPRPPRSSSTWRSYQAVRTHFFDAFFAEATADGYPPDRHPGLGPRLTRLSDRLARRHHRLRDRPAQGARVQGRDTGRPRRAAGGSAARGADRPAPGLAVRAAGGGLRPGAADRVAGRGAC